MTMFLGDECSKQIDVVCPACRGIRHFFNDEFHKLVFWENNEFILKEDDE